MYLNGIHVVGAITGSPTRRVELVVVQGDCIGDVLRYVLLVGHQSLGNSLGPAHQHRLDGLLVHQVIEHLVVVNLKVVHQTSSLWRKAMRFGDIVSSVQELGGEDPRFAVSPSLKQTLGKDLKTTVKVATWPKTSSKILTSSLLSASQWQR